MQFGIAFFRFGAVCSVLSAVSTLLLIFLPEFYAPAEGFEGRMNRVNDPVYTLRSWVYLVHPFLVMSAATALAMRIRRRNSAGALVGMLGFLLWGCTEAAQQTLTLFAFDEWRATYATADAVMREHIEMHTHFYDGLWDAMYVLLLVGFGIGNLALGVSMSRSRGMGRIVGYFSLGAFALTLANLLAELGGPALPEALGTWAYALIQPAGRALLGVWLWLYAVDERGR